MAQANKIATYHAKWEFALIEWENIHTSSDITSRAFFLCMVFPEVSRIKTSSRQWTSTLLVKVRKIKHNHDNSLITKTTNRENLKSYKKKYMEQYSAMSLTTALAVPSCSSRRLSSNGSTESICLVSVRLLPGEWFALKRALLNMQTTPSITSSSWHWSFKEIKKKENKMWACLQLYNDFRLWLSKAESKCKNKNIAW